MYVTLIYGSLSLVFLCTAAVLCVKNIHIYQLNSYKPNVQRKWVRDNIGDILLRTVWALGAVYLARELGIPGLALCNVLFTAVLLLNLPKKAKKPLVFTARVKRLLATYGIIHIIFAAAGFVALDYTAYFCLVFSLCLVTAPWLVLFADFLNRPLEKAINNRYINEAKKIINGMPELKVIGVTGSYGKTSVKFYIEKLLSVKYNVLATPENYNTTLGVVRTIRERLRPTHEVFVCEMGARNVGDIREICELVRPKIGVITSIGPQHLESFKTVENVIKTKFELIASLPSDGTAILNMDNEYIAGHGTNVRTVGYGTSAGEYKAENITYSSKGSSFTVKGCAFETKLIGRHNVQNVCAAIAAASILGIPLEKLVQPVRKLENVPHRLQLLGGGNRLIIDDAYNSNPAGAASALETLSNFDGVRILVTPGMVELGSKQYELNRELGVKAASSCDWAFIVRSKLNTNAEAIKEGLLSAGFEESRLTVADALNEAVSYADGFDTGGRARVILLENDLPDNY
jgi:UDP-N-acetylmuramoyl-tripeptide--D-alanyl-D-alanine ligase